MRAGPAKRIAGWNRGAKQKPMPASSMQRGHALGPEVDDDAERLEHVGRPALRRRGPVAVLGDRARRRPRRPARPSSRRCTVPARSPPVPQVSIERASGRPTSTRSAKRSIVRTSAASSAGVSPFARSATAKPAICASVASPARIVAERLLGELGRQVLAAQQRPSTSGQSRSRQSSSRVSPTRGRGRARHAR